MYNIQVVLMVLHFEHGLPPQPQEQAERTVAECTVAERTVAERIVVEYTAVVAEQVHTNNLVPVYILSHAVAVVVDYIIIVFPAFFVPLLPPPCSKVHST